MTASTWIFKCNFSFTHRPSSKLHTAAESIVIWIVGVLWTSAPFPVNFSISACLERVDASGSVLKHEVILYYHEQKWSWVPWEFAMKSSLCKLIIQSCKLAHMIQYCPGLTSTTCCQVGGLALTGVVLFSGSCYASAITEDRANSKLAPFGGSAFILAWLALAL